MTERREKPPTAAMTYSAITGAGDAALMRHMLLLLIEKGLVTQSEASGVFTAAAEEVRSATEDEADYVAMLGEAYAQQCETHASWLLR